ncbi:hypothetical protein [Neisseria montereyensis]|uniref:DUF262 domain-containing protein n=1 Tax=Neisseria montereyensis TaxID=2973938 RepID=A0ABT2FBK5_9NEIS|nr:hypothetical protein [Neisseria montereyensis]MCS4533528.1 hypothetical protein [Neisseria montereyensis]
MTYIPYEQRCIELPSGTCFIWLYCNKKRESSMLELILDNNALVKPNNWLKDIQQIDNIEKIKVHEKDRVGINVSLYLAFVEQYLSNKKYTTDIVNRTDSFIKPFKDLGIPFENGFSSKIEQLLINNEKQIRTDWMMSYLYIVLLYRITFAKKDDKKPFELVQQLKDKNVPCFSSLIMLCCLAEFLNKNKNIKMVNDNKSAYSYLSDFMSIKPSQKGENSLEEKYFRNRAGDLLFWLAIPNLLQNNYQPAGELMVVTDDKALKKLIFRCFPFVWRDDKKMSVSFDENSFDTKSSEKILSLIEENLWEFTPPSSDEEKIDRLTNLKNHVLDGVDDNVKYEVEKVWNEWLKNGFGTSYTL